MLALGLAICWILLVTVGCFRTTKRFWTGFCWSLVIAAIPEGLSLYVVNNGFTSRERLLFVEFMMMLVMIAGVVGLVTRELRKNRGKPNHDQCRACGYNLAGNVSGVCPECGNRVGESA